MSSKSNPRSALENVVFGLSLVAVVGLVALLIYAGTTAPSGPPDVRVAIDTVATARPEFVPIRVENQGGLVAEDVRVEVCDARDRCGELDIAYVPVLGVRRGTVGFQEVPAEPLTVRVVSFQSP